MNGKNPLHKKIKNKIEQHEFDFDPNAWAEMESLLNEQSTPNVENTKTSSFKIFKILGIMTTLFIVFCVLFWQRTNDVQQTVLTDQNIKTENVIIENNNFNNHQNLENEQNQKTKNIPSFLRRQESPNGNGSKLNSNQSQKPQKAQEIPAFAGMTEKGRTNYVILPPTDTSKIKTALNTYASHYQNEKVFIQLDKTIYKPTEAVWFNVFVRNSNSFKSALSELVYVELIAPNGKTLKTLTLLAKDGMAAGDFQLTDEYNGGLYTLKAYTMWQKNTGDYFEKTLQIQKTVLPKLNMTLEFARKAYGAGDEVVADLKLENITNEPLVNLDFDFTVSLAGQQILTQKSTTNENGKTEIKFTLPKDLSTNDGLLNVLIPHNGSTESIARSIPIVLNKIDVQFLPEGGDLVANVQSNVAFKAINEFGQPADIEGEIYNSKNEKVAEFSSYHQGMGSFEILAKANEKYTAKITKPVGISESYVLPLAKANTANLNIIEQTKDKIIVRLSSNVAANYVLTLTTREKIFFTKVLDNLNGEKTIEISTNDLPIGIAQLTLFSANQPIAERLAFVNPHQQLNIDIETDKENYRLRETVKAKIKVTDENGNPVKGQFSVSVVDETLLTHADDKQANILAYFLLTSDLKGEIKEPNFYFEPTEADDRVDRKKALDYVLLTHGWRRFGWEKMLAGNFPRFGYQFETTKFQGQVVDAFNRPLANAKVEIEGDRRWKDATYETTTDANGFFTLSKVGMLPPFTLKATYDEFKNRQEIKTFRQNCRMQLMANYSRDIYGRVVDYRSNGLKKAIIEITGKKVPTLTAVSDSEGNWVIPNVDLHKYNKVSMIFEEEQKQELDLGYYAKGNSVFFRSQKNKISTLEGKAVNHRREPLEGVMVTLQGMKDTVWTNEKGKFTVPNVDFSKHRVIKGVYDGGYSQINFYGKYEPILRFRTSDDNIKVNYADETTDKPVIRGEVLDESIGESLIGANILVYQNGKVITGISTDIDGKFVIKNLPKGKYDLEFRYVGFDNSYAKDVEINGRNVELKVPMYNSAMALNDVVVTGYGTNTSSYVDEYITVYDTVYAMKTVEIPAKYKTVSKRIEIPPTVREIEIPAEYKTIKKRVEVSPGVFEEIEEQILVKEAYVRTEVIPASFETVTESVLVASATTKEVVDKSQPATITPRHIKKTIETKVYAPISFPTATVTDIQNIPTNVNTAAFTQATPTTINDVNVLDEVVVTYQVPLVEQDNTTQGTVVTSKEIDKLPSKNINGIVAQSAGVSSNAIVVRGSRSNATDYYIDGIRVSGNLIPQSEIEQIPILTNGTPASFGDITGGVRLVQKDDVNFYTNQDNEQIEKPENRFYLNMENDRYYYGKPGTYTASRAIVDYGYSVKFKNGYYKARQFYTPKYGATLPKIRDDFRTTLFWENNLETDEKGEAKFEFPNADVTTNYRITVAGFSDEGGIGLNTEKYFVQMPFALQTKVPNSVLTGDKVVVPITLMNNTDKAINGNLMMDVPPHFELLNIVDNRVKLQPNEVKVVKLEFLVGNEIAFGDMYFGFKSEDFEDAFSATIQTISRGFPVSKVMADNKKSRDFEFDLTEPIHGTVDIKLTVHPNVLSDLVTGVDRMFRQPSGCFEQVSSSNYPNLLALNYLRNTNNKNQKIEAQAERFLAIGYGKIKGYEVEGGGFDWYGKAPAHEGLSAYGLMQLVDMQNVYDVDKQLISRTANWLLNRRDGEGNWQKNSRALHTWVGSDLVFNNYIIWGLTEAGYGNEISKEIEANYEKTIQSENPYVMALMANTLSILNDERADDLIEALLKMQNEDGSWQGKERSIVGSSGKGLNVETTALVALAIMDWEADEDLALRNAIDYLAKAKNQYGFGSTQSTVLALKALVEYAEYSQNMGEDGQIILYRGVTEIANFYYEADMNEPIIFDSLQQYFNKENNKLKVRFVGVEKALPYDLSVNYNTTLPQNNPLAHIQIKTTIDNPKAMIGETVRLQVKLNSTRYVPITNPIAVVGIPSGLTLQPWQLRELQEKNVADYIELWNGYIVFYFREMTGEKVINLDLKAEAAGTFEAPASSAYLYYDNDKKSWSLPQKVEIQ